MYVTRMHDVEIDRYPTISTSACVRSGLTRRPRPPEPAASHAESARAAPLRSRTDRDPMPSGTFIRSATSWFLWETSRSASVAHLLAGESPKGRFSSREAPLAAVTRCSPEVESAIRCRAVPLRSSRTPCEVGPTTARHPQCPFSPSGQGGRGSKRVEVRCKTPSRKHGRQLQR